MYAQEILMSLGTLFTKSAQAVGLEIQFHFAHGSFVDC